MNAIVYHKYSFFVKCILSESVHATTLDVHYNNFNVKLLRKNRDFYGPTPGVRLHYPVTEGIFPPKRLRKIDRVIHNDTSNTLLHGFRTGHSYDTVDH